ncbi:hypothetical protein GCM10023310_08160 [Paenibacillus vulneris]|uniref:Helix-turn-helix domain-containing protein n=1 Tax=Paenibacillus vulneris TaxID=1133364 RepID=A0ABW3UMH6_9BACL
MRGRAYFQLIRNTPEEIERLLITTRWDLCRLRRRALGNLTQEEYAEKCGVSAGVIRRLESRLPYNPAWPSERYLQILGVTFDFIIDHVIWPTTNENSKKFM